MVNLCMEMGFIDFNTNELVYQLLFRGGWKLFNHKNLICKSKAFYARKCNSEAWLNNYAQPVLESLCLWG